MSSRARGKPQMILNGSTSLDGVDPTTGSKLWSMPSEGETGSPAFRDGIVYVDRGLGGGGVCADLSTGLPVIKWKCGRTEMGEGPGAAAIVDGLVYKMHHQDRLLCRKAATGETVFTTALKQMSTWPSPITTADPYIYFASAGKSYVIRPGTKLEIIATNDLNDASPAASAAMAHGRIFLRGDKFLYCIGGK